MSCVDEQGLPCLTKVWLVSRRISQPSTIMRSIAKFFLMFSVSLTSSCIILRKRTFHHSHLDLTLHLQQTQVESHIFFCVSIPGKLLQLRFGIVQTVSLYVFMGRVGQEFVERENIARNLERQSSKDLTCNRKCTVQAQE